MVSSRPDPHHPTTSANPSFPPFRQLRAAPTTVDHRCFSTTGDINLSRVQAWDGEWKPQVYLLAQQSWWAKNNLNDFHSLFMQRVGPEKSNGSIITQSICGSVCREERELQWPVGSGLCSNKVSWVLFVMISDVTGSGGGGSPCAEKGKKYGRSRGTALVIVIWREALFLSRHMKTGKLTAIVSMSRWITFVCLKRIKKVYLAIVHTQANWNTGAAKYLLVNVVILCYMQSTQGGCKKKTFKYFKNILANM